MITLKNGSRIDLRDCEDNLVGSGLDSFYFVRPKLKVFFASRSKRFKLWLVLVYNRVASVFGI